jgi:fatty-acyl-CoA synthase
VTDNYAPVWDLRLHASSDPERTAICCETERLSYGELESRSNQIADVFRQLGLTRGDHIASLLGNRPESLAIAWAAYRSGLYLTPIATSLTATEVGYLIDNCDARAVIVDAAHCNIAESLPSILNQGINWLSLRGMIPGFMPLESLVAMSSPDPHVSEPPGALMIYTSGTTGSPRGVLRPLLPADYRGTPPFVSDLIPLFELGGNNVRYLSTAPLYHAAPLRFALAVTAGGGTVHVMERFDPEEALTILERESITHSQWVPTMFQRLLSLPSERRTAFKAPHHRAAIHGAAPCSPQLKQAIINWWGPIVIEYYSGTEGIGLTLIDSQEALQRPGSIGRARKGTVHIADASGVALPAGATGLVCFSGVSPFVYYKAPEKTASRSLPQGWQTFGDIGHIDADGYVYLTDRENDMIISGGVNLYPQEIEAVIREAPGVWDCAVVGVPDEQFGERPVAYIVTIRSSITDGPTLITGVQGHCTQHLGRFKRPSEIHILDSLPYSPTGKLLRRRLRELSSPE